MSNKNYIPYARQYIDNEDIRYVQEALNSELISSGPYVEKFEQEFAKITNSKYAVACSSGTAALHLASKAINIQKGDNVVIPTVTFLATANAPYHEGANIVFADVNGETGLLDKFSLNKTLQKYKSPIKAIFPVHLNGSVIDMKECFGSIREDGVYVIEDASHALGAHYKNGPPVGSCQYSDMTVFSFHPVKMICMGEGGMVTTNDKNLYKNLKLLRNHGLTREFDDFENYEEAFELKDKPNRWYYEMKIPSLNFRSSDINCALGYSQLKKLNFFIEKRSHIVGLYDSFFSSYEKYIKPVKRSDNLNRGIHLYVVLIEFERIGISRNEFMKILADKGVGTQVHYLPLHRQIFWNTKQNFSGADKYYSRCLSLPLFPSMNDSDVKYISESIIEIFP